MLPTKWLRPLHSELAHIFSLLQPPVPYLSLLKAQTHPSLVFGSGVGGRAVYLAGNPAGKGGLLRGHVATLLIDSVNAHQALIVWQVLAVQWWARPQSSWSTQNNGDRVLQIYIQMYIYKWWWDGENWDLSCPQKGLALPYLWSLLWSLLAVQG